MQVFGASETATFNTGYDDFEPSVRVDGWCSVARMNGSQIILLCFMMNVAVVWWGSEIQMNDFSGFKDFHFCLFFSRRARYDEFTDANADADTSVTDLTDAVDVRFSTDCDKLNTPSVPMWRARLNKNEAWSTTKTRVCVGGSKSTKSFSEVEEQKQLCLHN